MSEKFFGDSIGAKDLKDKFSKLEEENIQLNLKINEKNQMINLQRQENESLEEHYSAMEKIYHRTEKENLKLINIKENFISYLDKIIKKLDNGIYNLNKEKHKGNDYQNLRTDLVHIFQIILNQNDIEGPSYIEEVEVEYENNQNNNNKDLNKIIIEIDKKPKKGKKNNSCTEIRDNESYENIKNPISVDLFPKNSNSSKKDNSANKKIHKHKESAGSEYLKNNKKEVNIIKNIKIKKK